MPYILRTKTCLLAGVLAGVLSGCATLHLPWDKNRVPQATAQNPVVRIVCLWEQAEGRDPDGLPCRGFAGQILFLANRNAMPVQSQGDVRIYLFDDVGNPEEQSLPLRQFDFSSEAWQIHLTKSAIGPSYSVFVPYVRRGQTNAQCSLRVRLTPENGPVIFSDVASLPLRGPESTPETTIISEPYSDSAPLQSQVNSALSQALSKTTTIPLANTGNGDLALAKPRPLSPHAAASAPVDERLDRMERLLQQALAERPAAMQRGRQDDIQQAGYEVPADDAETPAKRFKLSETPE